MTTAALLVGLMLSACSTTKSNIHDGPSVEAQVTARFHSLVDAVRALDPAAYFSHFHQDLFTALNANGTVTHNFETFKQDYLAGTGAIIGYRNLEFSNVEVRVIDAQTVILVNEYEARVELEDGSLVDAAGAGSQVWHWSDGEWLLVSISSSIKAH